METVNDIKKELIDNYLSQSEVKRKYAFKEGETLAKSAIESLLFYAVSFSIWVLKKFIEKEKSEIENIVNTKMYGTVGWWHSKVLAWQHGDSTVVKNGTVTYETIDESKQLVAQVAVAPQDRTINIKVAKVDGDDSQPLTSDELKMLWSYVQEVKPAGLVANVVSLPADELTLTLDIYYDGELVSEAVKESVELAINKYVRDLPFNGDIYRNRLIDSIRVVMGVNDCVVGGFKASEYSGKVTDVVRVYSPLSGYYKVKSLTINMIAE